MPDKKDEVIDSDIWERFLEDDQELQDAMTRHALEVKRSRRREGYEQARRYFEEAKNEPDPREAARKAWHVLEPLTEHPWTRDDLPDEFIREVESFREEMKKIKLRKDIKTRLKALSPSQHRSWKRPYITGNGNEIILDTSWHPDELESIDEDPSVVFAQVGVVNGYGQNWFEEEWNSTKIDLSPLTQLPNLRELVIHFDAFPKDFSVLADCSNLSNLCISNRSKKELNLDILGELKQIKNLWIFTGDDYLDMRPISSCTSLEMVKIRWGLYGVILPSHPKLKSIDLSDNVLFTRYSLESGLWRYPEEWPDWPCVGKKLNKRKLLSLDQLEGCDSLHWLDLSMNRYILGIDLSEMDGLGLNLTVDLRETSLYYLRPPKDTLGIRYILPHKLILQNDGIYSI